MSVNELKSPDHDWDKRTQPGDRIAFAIWIACFLLMTGMILVDLIMSWLG